MASTRDMVTEEEACEKHCPLARRHPMKDSDQQSLTVFDVCIASKCMFWRWSHQVQGDTPLGFCGAAGLPKYL